MTLRQLEYILAVARAGSFTRAAQDLHVAQPSLSQQIRALESEVGGPLLERPPGPVRLTPAGRALAAEARAAVTSAQRALDAARRAVHLHAGRLEVCTVRSLAVSALPECIRAWHDEHPGVTVHLQEFPHRAGVEAAVRDGEGEIGVAPEPTGWTGAVRRLGWDQLVAVLPPRDPVAAQSRPVALEALAGRDWVLFEPGHGLAEHVEQACRLAGFAPRGVVETAQVEAAARLAAAGVGPALVPIRTVPADLATAVRALDPPVVWPLAAYTASRRWSRVASAFLEVLARGDWQRRRPRGARVIALGP